MQTSTTREQLLGILERAAWEVREKPEGISLRELCEELGGASFCFVAMLLSAPFFQPISLGPYSMLSGGIFVAVGWQMVRGRSSLTLPRKASGLHLRGKAWEKILRFCAGLVRVLSRWTKPRMEEYVSGEAGFRLVGWLILIGGALVAVPLANIPFNNTFPALMVFFAAVSWIERDGLAMIFSIFWGVVTLIYFALAGIIFYKFGTWVWGYLNNFF